ncbi:MAG TPA: acyl-CoA desaturase [Pseudonocardia sp.]|uniref:fatty acid desaturase family protein n=1 Tax=Pseudonocardia sp. TaxID=60912 RepID=UPI002ED89449
MTAQILDEPTLVIDETALTSDQPALTTEETAQAAQATLSPEQVAEFGRELDALRAEVMASRGERDVQYIHKIVAVQRGLEVGGRAALMISILPPAWLAGTAALSAAKILENMELGHNILHGQWDWMRDPEIHSSTWEWDSVIPAEGWKHTHNLVHHTWTNVVGKDRDLGYTIFRMSADQPWKPRHLLQPLYNFGLAPLFEFGIALYDLELDEVQRGNKSPKKALSDAGGMLKKWAQQAAKDYLLFPLLSGPSALPTLLGNVTANLARNIWTHTIIFCGHFPDGAEDFTEDQIEGETRAEWYLRQLRGSANLEGSTLFHIMSGNLSHQIEHHLFPDLPSNRYAEIAPRVRALCERYGLPYTSGPLTKQYLSTWARILRFSLPGAA